MASKGKWVTSGYRRGDLLVFHFGTGKIQHLGICNGVNKGGSLATIEGNTGSANDTNGGAVMRRTRYANQIVGACRPAYPSEAVMKKILAAAELEADAKITEYPSGSNKFKYKQGITAAKSAARRIRGASCSSHGIQRGRAFRPFHGGRKTASSTALATYYGYGKTTTTGGGGIVTITLDILKNGSSGAQVATLQRLLNSLGHNSGVVDGEFGPKTLAAVKSFQRAEGLGVDGVVGPKT
jgi:hypothetical protein